MIYRNADSGGGSWSWWFSDSDGLLSVRFEATVGADALGDWYPVSASDSDCRADEKGFLRAGVTSGE